MRQGAVDNGTLGSAGFQRALACSVAPFGKKSQSLDLLVEHSRRYHSKQARAVTGRWCAGSSGRAGVAVPADSDTFITRQNATVAAAADSCSFSTRLDVTVATARQGRRAM